MVVTDGSARFLNSEALHNNNNADLIYLFVVIPSLKIIS